MSDQDPTKNQNGETAQNASDQSGSDDGISKRELIQKAAWVTPVIISVNIPKSVYAQASPTSPTAPTIAPGAPTPAPTNAPTGAPTNAPTNAPTAAPTVSPT